MLKYFNYQCQDCFRIFEGAEHNGHVYTVCPDCSSINLRKHVTECKNLKVKLSDKESIQKAEKDSEISY